VVGLTLASALLRVQRLRTWYWIDEALSLGIASHPLGEIPSVMVKDGSPPLYYVLLAAWTRLFGTGEVATHALSLLIASAVVPVAFWAADRLFGRRAAWYAGAFAALSPFLTYFAGETRMYSLVVLEALLLATTFCMAFVQRRPRALIGFAASLVLLAYTHYWGLYAAVGTVVALVGLVAMGEDHRWLLRRAGLAYVTAAFLYLPWLPVFFGQLGSTGAPWSHTPTLRGVVGELAALVRDERVLIALGLTAGAGLLAVLRRGHAEWGRRFGTEARAAVCIALIGATPIAIGWVLAHLEPSWATRYLAVVVGPMCLLVGVGLARAGGYGLAGFVVAALLIVQPLTRISPGIGVPRASKSNAKYLAVHLADDLPQGTLVLVTQPEAVPLFATYLDRDVRFADPRGMVSDPEVMDWRDAQAELDAARVPGSLADEIARLQRGDRILLISPAGSGRSTDTAWIQRFRKLDTQWQRYLKRRSCLHTLRRLSVLSDGPQFPYRATLYQCGYLGASRRR
jgi:hypothetical protein